MPVLVPISAAFFTRFRPAAVASYARQNVAARRWPADAALALSEAEHERLLPGGPATPGSHQFEIRDPESGAIVGSLWLAVQTFAAASAGYVFNVEVDDAHRRKGFARRALLELEARARALGLASIGLSVFAFNHGARSLYDSLGYAVTGVAMKKRQDGAPDGG